MDIIKRAILGALFGSIIITLIDTFIPTIFLYYSTIMIFFISYNGFFGSHTVKNGDALKKALTGGIPFGLIFWVLEYRFDLFSVFNPADVGFRFGFSLFSLIILVYSLKA